MTAPSPDVPLLDLFVTTWSVDNNIVSLLQMDLLLLVCNLSVYKMLYVIYVGNCHYSFLFLTMNEKRFLYTNRIFNTWIYFVQSFC